MRVCSKCVGGRKVWLWRHQYQVQKRLSNLYTALQELEDNCNPGTPLWLTLATAAGDARTAVVCPVLQLCFIQAQQPPITKIITATIPCGTNTPATQQYA